MAIIRFTTTAQKQLADCFLVRTTYTNRGNNIITSTSIPGAVSTSFNNSNAYLRVYSGTINDLSNSTLLYESQLNSNDGGVADGTNYTITYGTNFKTATASGVATWFALWSSGTEYWAYGTVGNDSSFDLTIGNTTLIQGMEYSINNIKFRFPNAI